MKRYYWDVDIRALPDDAKDQLLRCRMLDRAVEWKDLEGFRDFRDIAFDCPDAECACDRILRPWRDNWSKMPK